MDPRQFRVRSQPDATLLAAAGRPKALEQAISASERVQAQTLVVALLQAQAMHRTKTIVPLDQPTDAEATDEIMASPASALGNQPIPSTTESPIELFTDYDKEIFLQEAVEESQKPAALPAPYSAPTELPRLKNAVDTTELTQLTPPTSAAEPVPAPAREWWLIGLLALLAVGIAAALGMLASWQMALAWLGVATGIALYLLTCTRQKLSRAKRHR